MMAGSASDEVLLVESGAVKVLLTAPDGAQSMIGLYGRGELIGELGVLRGEPRSATVVGQRDGDALHVPASAFRALVERHPEVLVHLNEILHERLRNADRRQLALASRDVASRVVAQILEWAREYGERQGTTVVVRGMTQRELAQAVAASEKSVDAELGVLRSAGLVDTGRCRLTLLRPAVLEDLLRST